jgi:FkbM family methyltransferase
MKQTFNKAYTKAIVKLATQQSSLLSIYFKYIWKPKPNNIESYIDNFALETTKEKKTFCFLQIGANNGYQHDPIFKLLQRYPHWQGILIEPQKAIFDTQLSVMYRQYKNLQLLNAAIATVNGFMPIYKIAFSNERWASGLTSFDRSTLERHIDNGYIDQCAQKQGIRPPAHRADYITTEQVTCVTFDTVITQYKVKNLDLLMIDTEGFDFEIIKMINFAQLKPRLIVFEHIHLSATDFDACQKLLQDNGYQLQNLGRDTAALCV